MFSDLVKMAVLLRVGVFVLSMMSIMAQAEVVVIVHPSNSTVLDKATLKKIFMGRTKTYPDGKSAMPVDLEEGDVKKAFLAQYLKKDQGSLDAYWARMLFTGSAMPPKVYKTQEQVKNAVASNPAALGYIDSANVDDSVKVIRVK